MTFYRIGGIFTKVISENEAITCCSLPKKEYIHHIKKAEEIEESKILKSEVQRGMIVMISEREFIEAMNLTFNRLKTL